MSRDPRFSILLPPGWVRIPFGDSTADEFTVLLDGVVGAAPAERRAALLAKGPTVLLSGLVSQPLVSAVTFSARVFTADLIETAAEPLIGAAVSGSGVLSGGQSPLFEKKSWQNPNW